MEQKEQTAVEWLVQEINKINVSTEARIFINKLEQQAKEMEKEQKGYSEEDVREMLFMALNEPEQECCITHTKDSIVRKVLKNFKSE